VERLAQRLQLLGRHDRVVERHRVDTVEHDDGLGHPALNLVAERASGNGQGDLHRHGRQLDPDSADHAQVHDRAVQLRVLDGSEGLDDLVLCRCHGGASLAQ
jgi:hypothetical protein